MNRMVGWPVFSRRLAAAASTRRMSATLDSTPLSRSNLLLVWRAMICASDVLPVPGGPKKISDWMRSASMARRSNWPGARMCDLPGKLVEVARAHPRGERLALGNVRPGRGFRPGFRRFLEQIVARHGLKLTPAKELPKTKNPPSGGLFGSAKKNPALAVCNCSFEHVLQHVGRAGLLSTSSEGVSAAAPAWVPGSYYYGSRISCLITNRAG